MNDSRGSIWRKWDFHLHTPSSYDYHDKSTTNARIVQALVDNSVEVAVITDHHFIDVARIKDLSSLSGNKITFLPGIELRSELGGKESIHFCGIFDEQCNIEKIWRELQVHLHISPEDIKSKDGNDVVYVDLQDSCKLIHDLGGMVSIHAGKKNNSIENIGNTEYFKEIQKTDIVKKHIDFFDLNGKRDIETYKKIVFPSINFEVPLILSSDNHDIKEYANSECSWVKGNPRFVTLNKVVVEPHSRICNDDEPEKERTVLQNPTKFIKSISFEKNTELDKEKWFHGEKIEFNHDLVSIIGNCAVR